MGGPSLRAHVTQCVCTVKCNIGDRGVRRIEDRPSSMKAWLSVSRPGETPDSALRDHALCAPGCDVTFDSGADLRSAA